MFKRPRHFYKYPAFYAKSNNLQFSFAKSFYTGKIKPGDHVLDIGCGDGRITTEFAKLVGKKGHVIGTDASPKMVEFANKKYAPYHKNLKFMQMDACDNLFDQEFNVVTSFNCLHWVKDQKKALKGIAKAASEEASVLLLLSHRKSKYHFTLEEICSGPKWAAHFQNFVNPRSFFDTNTYENLLRGAGLDPNTLVEKEMVYTYKSTNHFKGFLMSSMANVAHLPMHLRDEFTEDYIKEFLEQTNCSDPHCIPVSFWCLQVIAHKPSLKEEDKPACSPLKLTS